MEAGEKRGLSGFLCGLSALEEEVSRAERGRSRKGLPRFSFGTLPSCLWITCGIGTDEFRSPANPRPADQPPAFFPHVRSLASLSCASVLSVLTKCPFSPKIFINQ